MLETPLRDLSGDIIYEENSRGQLVAARRYSPEFWRDKYEAFRLIQDVKQVSLRQARPAPLPATAPAQRRNARRHPLARRMDRSCALLMRRSFIEQAAQPRRISSSPSASRPVLALADRDAILRYSDSGAIRFRLGLPHPDVPLLSA